MREMNQPFPFTLTFYSMWKRSQLKKTKAKKNNTPPHPPPPKPLFLLYTTADLLKL